MRSKLFVMLTIVGIIPLLLLMTFIFSSVQENYNAEMESKMLRQANMISTNLSVAKYFDTGERSRFLDEIHAVMSERILVINTRGEVSFDSNSNDKGKIYVLEPIILILREKEKYIVEKTKKDLVIYVPIYELYNSDEKGSVVGIVILRGNYEIIDKAVTRMRYVAILVTIGISIMIIAFTIYFSGLLTEPLRKFLMHIRRVSEGHIDERIHIEGNKEVEEIGNAFNDMLEKIEEIDKSRQEFVANVSHELKTPLSSMKVLAESLLSQEDVPIEFYREFMADINSEVDRETKIVNDLLNLVTLDKKSNSIRVVKINMNLLIEQVLYMLKPIAEKQYVTLEMKSYRQVEVEVDETKIFLALMNIIENAIKYNKKDGKVTVSLNANHTDMIIKVEDTGVGIPEKEVQNIFERFYRVDKARSRNTGGTGLGLSIAYRTIIMHGGHIKCKSIEGEGSVFIIHLPLSQPVEKGDL